MIGSVERSGTEGRPADPPGKSRGSGDFLFGLARKEKIKRPGKKPLVQVRFYWKRVFALLAVMGFLAWMSAATALYFFFKERRDFEDVSWFKMLVLPLRLDDHRREMGEFFIERGMREIEQGEFRSGFHHLRVGLARAPAHPEARIMLSELFRSGVRDRRRAIEVMEGGLRHADAVPSFLQKRYVGRLFSLLAEDRNDAATVRLADQLGPKIKDLQLLAAIQLQAAWSEVQTGFSSDALERMRAHRLIATEQGFVLLERIFRGIGEDRLALLALERGVEQYPRSQLLAGRLFQTLAEQERWDELESHVNFRRIVQPDFLTARTWSLVVLERTGQEEKVLPAARAILERFPAAEAGPALLLFAAEYGRPDVAELVTPEDLVDLPEDGRLRLHALACLRGGQPREAFELLGGTDEADAVGARRLQGLRSLAFLLLGEEEAAGTALQDFLQVPGTTAREFLVLGEALADLGYAEQAGRVLREGVARHPDHVELLELLMEDRASWPEGADLVELAGRMAEGRIPGLPVLEAIAGELASDRYLFAPERDSVFGKIDGILSRPRGFIDSVAVSASAAAAMENLTNPPRRGLLRGLSNQPTTGDQP